MVNKGDQIYFQTARGPKSGCVHAVGKHGATVECDGEHHKVKHHHVLGIKEPMDRKFKMVDKGSDGSLVEDEDGNRSYVAGDMPEAEGYLDKLTSLESIDDGDLVTRRIEREMHGTRCYQVLNGQFPNGSVYVGESAKRAVRLLGHLDTAGLAVPYEAVARSIVEGDEEKHGVLFAFTPEDEKLQDLVNAVAAFQRKSSLDTEDIMVIGAPVGGMAEAVLSHGVISGHEVLIIGERDEFESQPVYLSADLEHIMKARTLDNSTVLFMKAGAIKNKAGLSLQDVTDKRGIVGKRWKRNSKPVKKGREKSHQQDEQGQDGSKKLPDMHHGDSVEFQAGSASGSGEIVASGKDGATVKDESGREHKVHYDEMTDHKTKAPDYPEKQDGEKDKDYLKRIKNDLDHPDKLPEDHEKYFNMEGATTLPIDKLISGKTDDENQQGGNNSPKFMLAAYHGKVAKRDPISVEKMPDGKYKILDGNGTYTGVKKYGWKSMPVKVVGGDKGISSSVEDHKEKARELSKSILPPEKHADLGTKKTQPIPENGRDELFSKAEKTLDLLKDWLNRGKGIASQMGYTTMNKSPDDLTPDEWDEHKSMLFIAPLKGKDRATNKVKADYNGDWSQLTDVVRCTLAVESLHDISDALKTLEKHGMKPARTPKNKFYRPTPQGYMDMNFIVEMPDGVLAEIQFNVKDIMRAKNEGHPHYEVTRKIEDKYKEKGLTKPNGDIDISQWSQDDINSYKSADNSQKEIYSSAWTDHVKEHYGSLKKSLNKPIILLWR